MKDDNKMWFVYYRDGRNGGLSIERATYHADRMFYEFVNQGDFRAALEARRVEIAAANSHSDPDA